MKQDGDSLSHAVTMLHHYVDGLIFQFQQQTHGGGSYFDHLLEAVEQRCFLDPETSEAIQLQTDAARLMTLAAQIAGARAKLIHNMPPRPAFLNAAE